MTELPDSETAVSWREAAVRRSLGQGLHRARGVERSGQSLRSFYQYFGGKQELLLALFEEWVQSTVDAVWDRTKDEDDTLERLHIFVVEYYRWCRPPGKGKKSTKKDPTRALAEFAQQLLTAQSPAIRPKSCGI